MDTSNFLARAYGLYFIIMGFLLVIKSDYCAEVIHDLFKNRVLVFLIGWITLILGILVVLSHNIWEFNFKIIITILGYLTLLKGFAHLYMPERMKKMSFSNNIIQHRSVYGLLCLLGVALVYMSF